MPPGQRPVPGKPSTPKQTSATQAVALGGRAALDQQARAASYGATGQRQALEDTYRSLQQTGTGYSSHPEETSRYAQWQQSQGFRPQNYEVTFGRTPEGKYSGFKTEGELKAAILGSSELRREREMEQADILKDTMESQLGDLGNQYDQQAAGPQGLNIAALAGLGNARRLDATLDSTKLGAYLPGMFNHQMDTTNTDAAQSRVDVQGGKTQNFLGQLNDWYQQQGQPLVEGMETANQINQTPTREYALTEAANYGVDPALAAGWFPMSGQISDAANQRDLESLRDTGLPYSEQQSTLRQLGSDTEQAQRQQVEDDRLALSNDIFGVTSFEGDQLADAVDAPIEMVHGITTDPNFQTASQSVEQAMADADAAFPVNGDPASKTVNENEIAKAADEAIKDAMAQVMQATGDQATAEVLERILRSLYNI